MAITVTNPTPGKFGFFVNGVSADASACEELKAAPAAGLSIIIDHLTINSDAAITITIGEGETAGAVTTALIGPVSFAANQSMQWDFRNGGMVLTVATSLTVDSSGAGNICIFVQGRIE
jgi:hypothetical protein